MGLVNRLTIQLLAAVTIVVWGSERAVAQGFEFYVFGENTEQSSTCVGSVDSTTTEAVVEPASESFRTYTMDFNSESDGVLNIDWFARGKCFEIVEPTTHDSVKLAFEWELAPNHMGRSRFLERLLQTLSFRA